MRGLPPLRYQEERSVQNVNSVHLKEMETAGESDRVMKYRIDAKISFEMDAGSDD